MTGGASHPEIAGCAWRSIDRFEGNGCVTRVPEEAKEAMATLTQFAHKTYAPSTEQSRLAGAGAGLNDND